PAAETARATGSGAIGAAGWTAGAGTGQRVPHLGHLVCLPAAASGARKAALQPGQRTARGMAGSRPTAAGATVRERQRCANLRAYLGVGDAGWQGDSPGAAAVAAPGRAAYFLFQSGIGCPSLGSMSSRRVSGGNWSRRIKWTDPSAMPA